MTYITPCKRQNPEVTEKDGGGYCIVHTPIRHTNITYRDVRSYVADTAESTHYRAAKVQWKGREYI